MRLRARRGNTLVEFALVAVALFLVLLGALEMGRMMLVTSNVAHAARVGLRYAIVHGSTNTGAGVYGPSSGADPSQIVSIIKDYARGGLVDPARLQITVTYPDGGSNAVGSRVTVRLAYPYDPFTLLPVGALLGSTAQGVITF